MVISACYFNWHFGLIIKTTIQILTEFKKKERFDILKKSTLNPKHI